MVPERVAEVAPELQPRAWADWVLDLDPDAPDEFIRVWSGCHFCGGRLTLLIVLLLMLMFRFTLTFTSP